jgi:hypothetical protein
LILLYVSICQTHGKVEFWMDHHLPRTEYPLLIRTSYSDPDVWEAVRTDVQMPGVETGYEARFEFIDHPSYQDLTKAQVLSLLLANLDHSFLFIADQITLSHPEHPLLVADLYAEPGRDFRAIPTEVPCIEVNLSLANMDFSEFADQAAVDGIFRGFPIL